MKKVCSIILLIVYIIAIPFNVFANDKITENKNIKNQDSIVLINDETKEVYTINDYKTNNKYYEDGSVEKTITADICLNEATPRTTITDSGATVRISFTVSATKSGNLYRMTKISAEYTILDNAFSISNRHIKVANYGPNQALNASDYIYDYYPVSNSYTKPFYDLVWVDSTLTPAFVGGYAECKISRGGPSWSLQCRDLIVENDIGGFF